MASPLRPALIIAVTAAGAAVGGILGLIASALVLGVAARVGDVSLGVSFLFGLVGAVAGGAMARAIARRLFGKEESR